jgi:mono/diheme cytochrome c family protein
MGKRAFKISFVVLGAFLIASLAWVFGSTFFGQHRDQPFPVGVDSQLDNFAGWPARYQALGGDRNYVVPLTYFKGLSERFTRAAGETVVNFETGQVSVRVAGLPIPGDDSAYEALLVDNIDGPGNTVALDTGPKGDDLISLGFLDVQGPAATLEKALAIEHLRQFEVDMVVVRRVAPNGSTEFVIGGLAELFYKWNRSVSLQHSRPKGMGGWIRKQASKIGIYTVGEASQVNRPLGQMVEQGADLFFNETFNGNGRTCGTCHRTNNNLGLDANLIATLPSSDPLFVADPVKSSFNPALAQLENPTLMGGPRALILENIDGFNNPPVFRASPPLNNLTFTAPYGLSGEILNIPTFTIGAVKQHFPKNIGGDPANITRNPGFDFRLPTQPELDAMEAFMLSVFLPQNQNFNLANFVSPGAQQSGQDLFFGVAKCSQCHGGIVLSEAVPAQGGGNQSFNTGVVNIPISGIKTENLPPEANGLRKFSTPQLFAVANTGPFFHDHSVLTLQEAVAFYNSVQFNQSPAADPITGVGPISLTLAQVDDIVAFLQALQSTSCTPPASGVWVITQSCIFQGSATAPANVIVLQNVTLTIAGGASLDINFSTKHLKIKNGAKVVIRSGGKIH